MRLSLLPCFTLLAACASPLPEPNPEQAWVEMRSNGINLLMADRLDGKRWPDGRYFEVTPGEHQLEMRYQFERYAFAIASFREPQQITCYFRLNYAHFAAGQHYRVEANSWMYRPQAWLYDSQGQRLERAEIRNCLPF